jgi:uncharacterized membrane protein (UPF0127 family)
VIQRLVHDATGRALAERITWARSRRERARGLIARPALQHGEALIIERAKQVHTFGVASPIDVVFCDASWNVLHVVSPMSRHRVTRWVRAARFVIELPPGVAKHLKSGDRLALR